MVTTIKEISSEELAEELSKRRLKGEQELLAAHLKSNVQLVTGAVGPSYCLDVLVEGVTVSAMVDTGSQSTIVSRTLLHKVFKHLEREGKALPKLERPSTKLLGVSALESLISVDSDGLAVVPIQNFQGVCVQLDPGIQRSESVYCLIP